MRQQLVDARSRVRLHAHQHVREVVNWVDVVRLARGDEGVEPGQVIAGVIRPDEEEVLPSEGGDAERALGGVVVDGEVLIGDEERKRVPLAQC